MIMKLYTVLCLDEDCGGYSTSLRDICIETFQTEEGARQFIATRLTEFIGEDAFDHVIMTPGRTADGKNAVMVVDTETEEELYQVVEQSFEFEFVLQEHK